MIENETSPPAPAREEQESQEKQKEQKKKKENNQLIVNSTDWYTKPMYPTQNQSTQQSEQIKTESVYDPKETQNKSESLAIRRPQPNPKYKTQIDKTIEKAKLEGKQPNTIHNFYCKLRQLSNASDLNNPEDVKRAIAYAKLSNSSKCSFALAYEWYCKTNEITWQKPRYKWVLNPIRIPTTTQVERIISASTEKYATIFNLMKEIGVEGEELHQTHRNQYDKATSVIAIKGLKGHDSNNYKLKPYTSHKCSKCTYSNTPTTTLFQDQNQCKKCGTQQETKPH
jgi:hypothetical protein